MFCPRCGVQNEANSYKCLRCGEALQQTAGPAVQMKVPNYLVQAILVTLCCCLPFGIVAIVYAAQVNTKAQTGDSQGALDSSGKAKMWCWIGFGVGLVANLIVGAIHVLAVVAQQQGY